MVHLSCAWSGFHVSKPQIVEMASHLEEMLNKKRCAKHVVRNSFYERGFKTRCDIDVIEKNVRKSILRNTL